MNIKRNCILGIVSILGSVPVAQANEVWLLAKKQAVTVVYCLAHKNQNEPTQFDHCKSVTVANPIKVSADLDGYKYVGVVAVSVAGHPLPSNVNQFDRPFQCSITTDQMKSSGSLEFAADPHKITCETKGGIFG